MPEPFVRNIPTRWTDFDANRHANNAVYLTYLEHLRDSFFIQAGIRRDSTVLASANLTFITAIPLDVTEVRGSLACVRVGRSSITTTEILAADGAPAMEATSVSVYVDEHGRPAPVPDHVRRQLDAYRIPVSTGEEHL
ncbi:acyl-CoA thioesterase [Amycolatopsis halotolerans]|uniref:Acyl-CoA thioesterase n=1 Tax=Amycolatopsis halotolerans TaxID=330083 RepID=A0ABV7QI45_9PSEU